MKQKSNLFKLRELCELVNNCVFKNAVVRKGKHESNLSAQQQSKV